MEKITSAEEMKVIIDIVTPPFGSNPSSEFWSLNGKTGTILKQDEHSAWVLVEDKVYRIMKYHLRRVDIPGIAKIPSSRGDS